MRWSAIWRPRLVVVENAGLGLYGTGAAIRRAIRNRAHGLELAAAVQGLVGCRRDGSRPRRLRHARVLRLLFTRLTGSIWSSLDAEQGQRTLDRLRHASGRATGCIRGCHVRRYLPWEQDLEALVGQSGIWRGGDRILVLSSLTLAVEIEVDAARCDSLLFGSVSSRGRPLASKPPAVAGAPVESLPVRDSTGAAPSSGQGVVEGSQQEGRAGRGSAVSFGSPVRIIDG